MTHVTEQLSSVEISAITPRAFPSVLEPGSPTAQVTKIALEDYVTTALLNEEGITTGQVEAADHLLFEVTQDGIKGELSILDDASQELIAASIDRLRQKSPDRLRKLLELRQYAGYVAAVQTPLMFPRPISLSESSQDASEVFRPEEHAAAAIKNVTPENQPWQKVFKLGPLAISFALQPKRA